MSKTKRYIVETKNGNSINIGAGSKDDAAKWVKANIFGRFNINNDRVTNVKLEKEGHGKGK